MYRAMVYSNIQKIGFYYITYVKLLSVLGFHISAVLFNVPVYHKRLHLFSGHLLVAFISQYSYVLIVTCRALASGRMKKGGEV